MQPTGVLTRTGRQLLEPKRATGVVIQLTDAVVAGRVDLAVVPRLRLGRLKDAIQMRFPPAKQVADTTISEVRRVTTTRACPLAQVGVASMSLVLSS